MSLENGLTDTTEGEAFFRKLLIQRSVHAVLLADHSKIDVTSFFAIAPLMAIHILVTDAGLGGDWHIPGLKLL